jgi:hypothetical protein
MVLLIGRGQKLLRRMEGGLQLDSVAYGSGQPDLSSLCRCWARTANKQRIRLAL